VAIVDTEGTLVKQD